VEHSRLVYSTEGGRVKPDDRRPAPSSGPRGPRGPQVPNDGVVRVFRDRGGRKGKTVTLVTGVPASARADVAARLKRALGTGGGVHEDVIEIQGDHREPVAARLGELGYRVKLAGG
jgi:translation initiation factor 1